MCNAGAGNIISGYYNGYNAVGEGWQKQKEGEMNAKRYRELGQQTLLQGSIEQDAQLNKIKALKGTQLTQMGASGLDVNSGSFNKIGVDTVRTGQEDVNTIKRNSLMKAWQYEEKAKEEIYKGKKASDKGEQAAIGSILGGAGNVASW
jgi:hypothetical protein